MDAAQEDQIKMHLNVFRTKAKKAKHETNSFKIFNFHRTSNNVPCH
jgi:hypothetical protein